ncbi:MAG: sulfatase-like hydrolase/transferase [Planctomycetaceae bacterium]
MNRLFAAVLMCSTAMLQAADPVANHGPNVLFLMADDLRAELASYDSPAITPNLDRLAQMSVQFDRAYCQHAVCNPSRSSLLTGLRPDTLRVWNNGTHLREPNPDVMTLPLWFKDHGYSTRCVGKIFHNWHTKVHGDRRSWSARSFCTTRIMGTMSHWLMDRCLRISRKPHRVLDMQRPVFANVVTCRTMRIMTVAWRQRLLVS